MTAPRRVVCTGDAGEVFIVTDVTMANAIADALEYTFASDGLDHRARPDYLLDVAEIRRGVAAARPLAPAAVVPVSVLHVVGGDQP